MAEFSTDLSSLLRLRVLVLALGESKNFAWWKCNFLSPTGLSYLHRLYPRDYFAAALRSSSCAARAVHDSTIGIGSVFHLFRLPREIDHLLLATTNENRAQLITELSADKATLLMLLQQLAGDNSTRLQAGPVRMGGLKELFTSDVAERMAMAYFAAFQNDAKTFPYFEGQKSR